MGENGETEAERGLRDIACVYMPAPKVAMIPREIGPWTRAV